MARQLALADEDSPRPDAYETEEDRAQEALLEEKLAAKARRRAEKARAAEDLAAKRAARAALLEQAAEASPRCTLTIELQWPFLQNSEQWSCVHHLTSWPVAWTRQTRRSPAPDVWSSPERGPGSGLGPGEGSGLGSRGRVRDAGSRRRRRRRSPRPRSRRGAASRRT